MVTKRRKHHHLSRKMKRDDAFILDVLAIIILLILAIRYLPNQIFLSFEWFSGNQIARFALGIVAFIFLIVNLINKRPRAAFFALLPVILVSVEAYLHLPLKAPETTPTGEHVRVMTFNAGGIAPDPILDQIARDSVDIVCLQEIFTRDHLYLIERAEAMGFKGRFISLRDDAGMGNILLSRYKITGFDTLKTSSWGEKVRRFPRITTSVNGQDLRIVSLQLESTNRKNDLWGVIASWKLRFEQANRITEKVSGNSPLILAGDFNATVTNRAIRPLLEGYHDSWREAGLGIGGTWHRRLPLLRIDYVMYQNLGGARNAKTYAIGESDHIAYRVDIFLPETPPIASNK